jgi:hypothetical protein
MKTASETFNHVKITLHYNEPTKQDIVMDLEVEMENSEGKIIRFPFTTMNITKANQLYDFLFDTEKIFYEVLDSIFTWHDLGTFEDYCEEINLKKGIDEELREEYEKYKDIECKINSIVSKDWIHSMECYVVLI